MSKFFKTFGVMIDMSRNAVMSMDGLKRFLPLLKKMGYNCVLLYTEDGSRGAEGVCKDTLCGPSEGNRRDHLLHLPPDVYE